VWRLQEPQQCGDYKSRNSVATTRAAAVWRLQEPQQCGDYKSRNSVATTRAAARIREIITRAESSFRLLKEAYRQQQN